MNSIDNGNWTEWSAIWAEIICVISKSNELAAQVWFVITRMISDQNCTTGGSITTLLHPFWNCPNTGLGQFKLMQYWAGLKFNSSIFWQEKIKVLETKVATNVTKSIFFFRQLSQYWKKNQMNSHTPNNLLPLCFYYFLQMSFILLGQLVSERTF